MPSKEDLTKNKDEDIVKLKKLALLFKNECKKLQEENASLRKQMSDKAENSEDLNPADINARLKNEHNKRVLLEKNYKKLKEFTVLLEEKFRAQKNENSENHKGWEAKINELHSELKKKKMEGEVLKETIKEKETTIFKLNEKIDELRSFMKEKNVNLTIEKKMNEVIAHKVEIKKLRDRLESVKRSEEITSKERQQYKSVLMLCSQYKEKCMKIPKLETRIEVLENQIRELELYRVRDEEKTATIQQLKNEILQWNMENNKLREQLNEWSEFSKVYINDKAIDIDALKVSMMEIYNKYNTMNLTKTDLELKYAQLSVDMNKMEQQLEDKHLELKISENKYRQLEAKYHFLKKDFSNQVSKKRREEHGCTSAAAPTGSNQNLNADEKMRLEKLNKQVADYKRKYELFKEDNAEKTNIIVELCQRVEVYKRDYQHASLQLKSADLSCETKVLLENEVLYLREEIENYKQQVMLLENDLVNVTNSWNADKERHLIAINELKESFKKKEMENKIKAASRRDVGGVSDQLNTGAASNKKNDISALYKHISDLNTWDDVQISALKNEILYLRSKIEVIKFFYSDQIKNYREAILYILGWDMTIEHNDDETFFILNSLFATHDGQFVFIKNKCTNEKRNLENQHENVLELKKMKLAHELNEKGKNRKKEFVNVSEHKEVSSLHFGSEISDHFSISGIQDKGNLEKHKDNLKEHIDNLKEHRDNLKENKDNLKEHKDNLKEHKDEEEFARFIDDDSQFYEELLGDRNMVNMNAVKEKLNCEDTNINMPSIVKGSKYNLLLNGYYSVKWQENGAWKNYMNKINTYPIMLALSCIEEYNHIKSQYNPSLGKNFKGMLFKI